MSMMDHEELLQILVGLRAQIDLLIRQLAVVVEEPEPDKNAVPPTFGR